MATLDGHNNWKNSGFISSNAKADILIFWGHYDINISVQKFIIKPLYNEPIKHFQTIEDNSKFKKKKYATGKQKAP